jgi:hypothetical protein
MENVVLYISEGLTGSALTHVPTSARVFDQKNCVYTPHVVAMDVGRNSSSNQRLDHPQDSSAAQPDDPQYPVE